MFGCTHYQIWLYYSLNEVRNQMKWRTLIVTILQFCSTETVIVCVMTRFHVLLLSSTAHYNHIEKKLGLFIPEIENTRLEMLSFSPFELGQLI